MKKRLALTLALLTLGAICSGCPERSPSHLELHMGTAPPQPQ
jgi:hypothetical protein